MDNDTSVAVRENQATSPPSPGGLPDLKAIYAECRARLNALPRGAEFTLNVEHRETSFGTRFDVWVHHDSLRYVQAAGNSTAGTDHIESHTGIVSAFEREVLPLVRQAVRVANAVDKAVMG